MDIQGEENFGEKADERWNFAGEKLRVTDNARGWKWFRTKDGTVLKKVEARDDKCLEKVTGKYKTEMMKRAVSYL